MKPLVVYESRSGHTRRSAEAIAEQAKAQEADAVVRPVGEVSAEDVASADAVAVGTWVKGFILFGMKPAGAEGVASRLPALGGKPTGVFCSYAFNPAGAPAALADRLRANGARIVATRAFHRNRPTSGAAEFARQILGSVPS